MTNYWSEKEIDTLRQMISEGKKYREITNTIGRSYGAVVSKAKSLGIKAETDYHGNVSLTSNKFKDREFNFEGEGTKPFSEFNNGECLYMPKSDMMICGKKVYKCAYCEEHYRRCHRQILDNRETDKSVNEHRDKTRGWKGRAV